MFLFSSISVHCSSTEFECSNPRKCIPSFYRCNGYSDCGDNSDENECDAPISSPTPSATPTSTPAPTPSSTPSPTPSSTECFIISGPGTIGSKCIFPFKHKGVTYRACPVKNGQRWCPTKVENQIFDPSSVGVCSESCPNYDYKGK